LKTRWQWQGRKVWLTFLGFTPYPLQFYKKKKKIKKNFQLSNFILLFLLYVSKVLYKKKSLRPWASDEFVHSQLHGDISVSNYLMI